MPRARASSYAKFCQQRGISVYNYPVEATTYCDWLHTTAARIKISSMDMYMAGLPLSRCLLYPRK